MSIPAPDAEGGYPRLQRPARRPHLPAPRHPGPRRSRWRRAPPKGDTSITYDDTCGTELFHDGTDGSRDEHDAPTNARISTTAELFRQPPSAEEADETPRPRVERDAGTMHRLRSPFDA